MYYTSVNNGIRFNMHVFFHRHTWHKYDLLRLWIIYVCIYLFILHLFAAYLMRLSVSENYTTFNSSMITLNEVNQ